MFNYTCFQHCPKCGGSELIVWHQKGMRCATCQFVYFHNSAAAVAGIIETDAGIVLARRAIEPKFGYLDLPGGFVDYNESFEQALAREIQEELGAEAFDFRYVGSFSNVYEYGGVTYFTVDAVFACQANHLPEQVVNDEVAAIEIVNLDEFDIERMAFHSLKAALQHYRKLRTF